MHTETVRKLDQARHIAEIPFVITSGYRCLEQNIDVGGAENSSHLHGFAADIRVRSPRERHIVVTALMEAGFFRFGVTYPAHVHVDDDPEKPVERMW